MPRTNPTLVIGVLMDDYGPKTDGTLPDLTPFINSAFNMVNQIVRLNAQPAGFSVLGRVASGIATDTAMLTDIETWLAAHFYCCSDKPLSSTSTGGGSGSFQGQTGKGFESTNYGLMAMRLDYSGTLVALDKRQVAGLVWAGKPPSQQIDYDQRD